MKTCSVSLSQHFNQQEALIGRALAGARLGFRPYVKRDGTAVYFKHPLLETLRAEFDGKRLHWSIKDYELFAAAPSFKPISPDIPSDMVLGVWGFPISNTSSWWARNIGNPVFLPFLIMYLAVITVLLGEFYLAFFGARLLAVSVGTMLVSLFAGCLWYFPTEDRLRDDQEMSKYVLRKGCAPTQHINLASYFDFLRVTPADRLEPMLRRAGLLPKVQYSVRSHASTKPYAQLEATSTISHYPELPNLTATMTKDRVTWEIDGYGNGDDQTQINAQLSPSQVLQIWSSPLQEFWKPDRRTLALICVNIGVSLLLITSAPPVFLALWGALGLLLLAEKCLTAWRAPREHHDVETAREILTTAAARSYFVDTEPATKSAKSLTQDISGARWHTEGGKLTLVHPLLPALSLYSEPMWLHSKAGQPSCRIHNSWQASDVVCLWAQVARKHRHPWNYLRYGVGDTGSPRAPLMIVLMALMYAGLLISPFVPLTISVPALVAGAIFMYVRYWRGAAARLEIDWNILAHVLARPKHSNH